MADRDVYGQGVQMTSAEALTLHLRTMRNRGLSTVYIDQRRRAVNGLAQTTGRDVLELTAEDLDDWQSEKLTTRTTARSRNTLVGHVREWYRWCHREELTSDDRGRRLLLAKPAKLVPRPIGESALSMALQMAPPRVKPMLYLAAFAGMRALEIANLRREDVRDADDPATFIVYGKGKKERVLPAAAPVLMELYSHGMPRRGPIFTMWTNQGPTLRPITAHRVSATCNAYLADVGVDASLHQLRHRFASQALRVSGGDLRLVQELLGHSSPSTTAIYTQHAVERAGGVVDGLLQLVVTEPVVTAPVLSTRQRGAVAVADAQRIRAESRATREESARMRAGR